MPKASLHARLRRLAVHAWLACAALAASALHAQGLDATFNTAADIPVTAPSYTASGEATFTLSFVPTPGTNLTVIKNTGLPFIDGQFTNLPNGSTVNLTHNGTIYPFIAWYYGGEGNNDLVLLWPYTGLATWGNNSDGQLGDTTFTLRRTPRGVVLRDELLGKVIVQVAHGNAHSLALCSDGTVVAWGSNYLGELGIGNNSRYMSEVPVAVNMTAGTSALAGKTVVAIAAGYSHSLALCSDGTMAAWGDNDHWQLGDGSDALLQRVPVAVTALAGKTAVAIAAGYNHSLALCSDGTVVAWNDPVETGEPAPGNVASGTSALTGKTVIAVAAGEFHSLALCSDGTVAAWGENDHGQLGDNSTTDSPVPVAVNRTVGTSALAGKTVTALAAGYAHSLALCNDGTVAAWGINFSGQLGDNSTTNRPVPVAVNVTQGTSVLAGKTVITIATGGIHSLALCSDGTLAAWGYNAYGQLGDNTPTNRPAPVAVNVVAGVSALANRPVIVLSNSSTANHSLVITNWTGPPKVTPNTANLALNATTLTLNGTGFNASSPGHNTVAFTPTGTGIVTAATTTSLTVSSLNGITAGALNAVVTTNGQSSGAPVTVATVTGLAATFTSPADIPVTAPSYTASGEATFTLSFAPLPGTNLTVIQNTGLPFITGQFANLPNGATVNLTHNGFTYRFIAWYYGGAGNNDLVLLWPYTGLATWGNNEDGQLGDGSTTQRYIPVDVADRGVLRGRTIVQVARGYYHSLALCTDGTVAGWGRNFSGEIGDNTTTPRLEPVAVVKASSALAGKTVIAIAAGRTHSLALCSDGTVAAWGYNSYGQLGDNSTTDRHTPVAVNIDIGLSALPGKSVVAIAADSLHSLALCSDGTVIAWGYNYSGQLGDNSTLQRKAPVAVNVTSGLSALNGKTVTAIAAGEVHSLALCHDGSVAAWGSAGFGQLGNNSTSQRQVPVAVNAVPGTSALAGKGVVALAAGGFHSLALCSDGTVAAWGNNYVGQLGDNTKLDRLVPAAVDVAPGRSALAGKSGVAIAVGSYHSMALSSDGRVAVWGSNDHGQLGNGTTIPRQVPIDVASGTLSLSSMRVTALSLSSNSLHSSAIYARRGPANVILSTKRAQTVTFAPPATVYLGQSPLSLHAHSSSGLPVTLSVVPTGTTAAGAVMEGQALLFTGPGTVKVQAAQAGGGNYAAAPGVVKTITVKADPTVLTLVDLSQPYTGTPRSISTLGGTGTMPPSTRWGQTLAAPPPPTRAATRCGPRTAPAPRQARWSSPRLPSMSPLMTSADSWERTTRL